MANPLAITLRPTGEVTASGQGAAVDIGTLRTAARVRLVVAALTAGAELRVVIETSPDGQTWSQRLVLYATAAGVQKTAVGPCERYVRATWTLEGHGSPSATFELAGEAHVLYADLEDLDSRGIRPQAFEDAELGPRIDALLQATADADGALSTRYKLPLQAWGEDLRARVVSRATYYLIKHRGFDPEGQDAVVILDGGHVLDNGARTAVQKWFDDVAHGRVHPAGIVDSTPAKREFGARVRSRSRRGWDAC